jgi:ABC-type polysaccharide/polyol phosphate export permease
MIMHMARIAETPMSAAIDDIAGALRRFRNCLFLATTEVKLRYRRSILGPLWITLTTAMFILFISSLYSGLMATQFTHYLINLSLGWIIWHFISDSVLLGARTFQKGAGILKNTNIDKFTLVLKTVLANLIVFTHNLVIPLLVFVVVGFPFSHATWLVIPAFALITLSALWSAMLFGLLCARYRDIYQLLQASMRVLFFLTPILWTPSLLPAKSPKRLFVDFNPFAHYLAIWRKPLMGEYPDALSWYVTGGLTVLGLGLGFLVFARYRREVVFWI